MAGTGNYVEGRWVVSHHIDCDKPTACAWASDCSRQRSCYCQGGAFGFGGCFGGLPAEYSLASSRGEGAAFLPHARSSSCGVVCATDDGEGHRDVGEGLLAGEQEAGAGLLVYGGFVCMPE